MQSQHSGGCGRRAFTQGQPGLHGETFKAGVQPCDRALASQVQALCSTHAWWPKGEVVVKARDSSSSVFIQNSKI